MSCPGCQSEKKPTLTKERHTWVPGECEHARKWPDDFKGFNTNVRPKKAK